MIGFSTLRLREDYLAIVTIGVSELIRLMVNNEELPMGNQWRSGAFGVQTYPIPLATFNPNWLGKSILVGLLTILFGLGWWKLAKWLQKQWKQRPEKRPWGEVVLAIAAFILSLIIYLVGAHSLYNYNPRAGLMLVILITLAVVYVGLEALVNSPWGRVLKAIREDEQVPKALGKNVFWYKLQAFMLGGAIAGISGSFFAWYLQAIYPNNFEPLLTFNAWTVVVLGGAGSNLGTLLGAILFSAYFEITRFVLPAVLNLDSARLGALRIMIVGLILMVLMIWRPQGILGKKEELTLGR